MESWIIDVTGNDVERAKAIIRTKTNRYDIKFVVRELPDKRSATEKEFDKACVVLWTLNGYVHRSARFELMTRQRDLAYNDDYQDQDNYSEEDENT